MFGGVIMAYSSRSNKIENKQVNGPAIEWLRWVNPPDESLPDGIEHKAFYSESVGGEVGYSIYLPPDYYKNETRRYSVIYWLHGIDGSESKSPYNFQRLNDYILKGHIQPVIVVFVNGAGRSMYYDSFDGKVPAETAFIKDLISYIDKTYRTVPSRENRGIEGFSMGGFGALKFAAKFIDTFSTVVTYGGAFLDAQSFAEGHPVIFKQMFNGDKELFQAGTPYECIKKNADRIRRNLKIRIVVGSNDGTLKFNNRMHEFLEELNIEHKFEVADGIIHKGKRYCENEGDKILKFHIDNFRSRINTIKIPDNLRYIPDVEYAYTCGRSLKLDILYPKDKRKEKLPSVVYIHGGGWLAGDNKGTQNIVLAQQGYFTISIEYRLSGEAVFPAQIEDCKAAVRWLRAHAEEFNIDPERIGVWGHSAGGHLSALMGTSAGAGILEGTGGWVGYDSSVQAVVDFFGPTDFTMWPGRMHDKMCPEARLLGGAICDNMAKAMMANPIAYIRQNTGRIPPFLIFHGENDPVVPISQSELLYEALKNANADVSFVCVKNGGHGFKEQDTEPSLTEIQEMTIAFFNKHLKRKMDSFHDNIGDLVN
jgi:acetyl esterase/lipase/enterochelin esterase-like enzyme